MPVTITDKAAKRFAELCQTQQGLPRIEISAGGCSGFTKRFGWAAAADDDDIVVQTAAGPVLIDTSSYDLLDRATVDYRTDLTGSYFAIDIPEAVSTCGCGSSFAL